MRGLVPNLLAGGRFIIYVLLRTPRYNLVHVLSVIVTSMAQSLPLLLHATLIENMRQSNLRLGSADIRHLHRSKMALVT